ncbi:MAG: hypothetical protein CHACPFDD_00941 [Phycisphaerae bacterium]|nr:hypothetical protein [Phycisphaerae bacterium]
MTNTPYNEGVPRLNNHKQIVWDRREPNLDSTGEIILYDNGTLVQITDDEVRDAWPDINDDGIIVWSSFRGPEGPFGPTADIMMYKDGVITQLTDDDEYDYAPYINNLGQCAWSKTLGQYSAQSEIYWYDGTTVKRLTYDGEAEAKSNQGGQLNELGQIVWTRYDFFVDPWEGEIRLYDRGQIRTLSPPWMFEAQLPYINNLGDLVWFYNDGSDQALVLWHGGHALHLTHGRNSRTNDLGHIYFIRWQEAGGWQAWLYRDSTFYQLTDDPTWSTDGDINNAGEVVWLYGIYPATDICLLQRYSPGDLNCDGSVDGFDVEPFLLALTDPHLYGVVYPACDAMLADVNADNSLNGFDIEPFVGILLEE